MNDELLTPAEFAALLKSPISAIYRISHLKQISVVRISHRKIRFRRSHVENFLRARTEPARGVEE